MAQSEVIQMEKVPHHCEELEGPKTRSLYDTARSVTEAIDAMDMSRLEKLVHPMRGLRLGLEGHAIEPPLVLQARELTEASMRQPFIPFYDEEIDDVGLMSWSDFVDSKLRGFSDAPLIGLTEIALNDGLAGEGSTLRAIRESYGTAPFVQLAWPFGPTGDSGKWVSLILVFEFEDPSWWLVAVIPNEWRP